MPDQTPEPDAEGPTRGAARPDRPLDLGIFGRTPVEGAFTATEAVAVALTLVWLVAVALFLFVLVPDTLPASGGVGGTVMLLLSVFMPIALIWVAAVTARTARGMRQEARRLQEAIDAMRHAYLAQQKATNSQGRLSVDRKPDDPAAAQRQTDTAIATFASRRDVSQVVPSADRKTVLALPRPSAGEDQPTLALGTPLEDLRNPISVSDFIRALNFPDNPEDRDGFRALRAALEDRTAAKLIRAAQDVLTLLSQDGIYMDDLKPDRARPEVWRKFAQGERGRAIASLGGVRDRSCLALTAGRMRSDTIFRDTAHHFLRQFDRTFAEFEKHATDLDLAELATTRTARAFMLLGRVTGTFD